MEVVYQGPSEEDQEMRGEGRGERGEERRGERG